MKLCLCLTTFPPKLNSFLFQLLSKACSKKHINKCFNTIYIIIKIFEFESETKYDITSKHFETLKDLDICPIKLFTYVQVFNLVGLIYFNSRQIGQIYSDGLCKYFKLKIIVGRKVQRTYQFKNTKNQNLTSEPILVSAFQMKIDLELISTKSV